MTELMIDRTRAMGLCPHGNNPASCEICAQAITQREYKDGLPVISQGEYERYYNTDIRALGQEQSVTFNFQGFVKAERQEQDSVAYRDVFATNGLLKGEGHKGIHLGIDGVRNYSLAGIAMESPQDLGEYDIYITVPDELAKEKGCYCKYDSCYPIQDFDGDEEELEELYQPGGKGWIVIRLGVDPSKDPLARLKVQVINDAIIRHIEQGKPLYEIKDLVEELEDQLEDITSMDLQKKVEALGA